MKIEVLGTRAKIKPSAPKYRKHTGFLIDDTLMLDVGEREFLKREPKAIVFTHFHPDHAFFVMDKEVFEPPIPHFGPESHELAPALKIVTGSFELEGYKITPVPVLHALRLKSFGYIVEKENKKVFFTGDVAWIEKPFLSEIPTVDLVVTEATMINKGGRISRRGNEIFGHTGVPDLIRILKPLSSRILFTHFGEWFYQEVDKGPEKLRNLDREGVELIAGYDGFMMEL